MSESIENWFEKVAMASNMKTETVPFSDPQNDDWQVTDGEIVRKDRRYYKVVFVKTIDDSETFYKPMIEPFSADGTYGALILLKVNGKYLVQAKAETGNRTPGKMVLTTTVQSSYENINAKKISYADMLENLDDRLKVKSVPQDAGMLYHKNNRYIFAEIEEENFEILPNFFLATREDIASLAKEGLVSEHLLQMLGLLWAMGL